MLSVAINKAKQALGMKIADEQLCFLTVNSSKPERNSYLSRNSTKVQLKESSAMQSVAMQSVTLRPFRPLSAARIPGFSHQDIPKPPGFCLTDP